MPQSGLWRKMPNSLPAFGCARGMVWNPRFRDAFAGTGGPGSALQHFRAAVRPDTWVELSGRCSGEPQRKREGAP
jgi:hypothetical protein